MIKSSDLLRRYKLHNGPSRLRAFDLEMKPCEVVNENSREFEELILSLYLLDKYAPNEKQLCFVTSSKDQLEEVAEHLEQLYRFLTARNLSIKFEIDEKKLKIFQERLLPMTQPDEYLGAPCLFSGGLDSAAGAATLLRENCTPTLCHTATNNITLGKMLKLHNIPPLRRSPLIVTDMRTEGADFPAGGTRGLLFLSNAIVLASSFAKNSVIFPENGPLMINPVVSFRAIPTKNAHPYLVTSLEKIFSSITKSNITITPIFKDRTKAEIAAEVVNEGIIDYTWSCFNVQSQSRMCGRCYACLVRRLSLEAIGYEEPNWTYESDPFTLDRSELKGVALQDIDILHDTLLYLEHILKSEKLTENELKHIPDGFFVDALNMMQRFSLDMFLGLQKYLSKPRQLGTLGKFAVDILQDIPAHSLSQRDAELQALIK